MAGGLPKGLLKKAEKNKRRQKNFRQSAQPNQDGPQSVSNTGKSLSEALIFASTNPQYNNRLFIELQVQYIYENFKLKPGENIVSDIQISEQFLYTYSPYVLKKEELLTKIYL